MTRLNNQVHLPSKVELINARPVPRPGVWILAAVVALIAAALLHSVVTNERYRWDVFAQFVFDPRDRGGLD